MGAMTYDELYKLIIETGEPYVSADNYDDMCIAVQLDREKYCDKQPIYADDDENSLDWFRKPVAYLYSLNIEGKGYPVFDEKPYVLLDKNGLHLSGVNFSMSKILLSDKTNPFVILYKDGTWEKVYSVFRLRAKIKLKEYAKVIRY